MPCPPPPPDLRGLSPAKTPSSTPLAGRFPLPTVPQVLTPIPSSLPTPLAGRDRSHKSAISASFLPKSSPLLRSIGTLRNSSRLPQALVIAMVMMTPSGVFGRLCVD